MLRMPRAWPEINKPKWQTSSNFTDSGLSAASTAADPADQEAPFELLAGLCVSDAPSLDEEDCDSDAWPSWSRSGDASTATSRTSSCSPLRQRAVQIASATGCKRRAKLDSDSYDEACEGPADVRAHTPRGGAGARGGDGVVDGAHGHGASCGSAGGCGGSIERVAPGGDADFFCSASDLAAARCMWTQSCVPMRSTHPHRRLLASEVHVWSLSFD